MNEIPKRKQIRLKKYDYSQNGFYFITICTHNRQNLFAINEADNTCNLLVKKWLFEIEAKFPDVTICKYVIMPDHIHFIISKSGDHTGSPLRDIIGWFKTMVTNDYICKVKQGLLMPFDKKIWQRNYYEHVIRNENDYIEKAEYIDNNPIKWLTKID